MCNDKNNLHVFISKTIDLLLDWYFIHEINNCPKHVDESTKQYIIILAIWGTSLALCRFVCGNNDDENACKLSLLSTITKDFPQIILAIVSATHLISFVQIAKAVYGIIEPFKRAVNLFNDREKSKKSFRKKSHDYDTITFLDMTSCCVLCLCSIYLLKSLSNSVYRSTYCSM